MKTADYAAPAPKDVISNPSLLFLYHRLEQILGIKVSSDALVRLNKHLEEECGGTFVQNPEAYENMLTSREQIYDLSKMLTVNETYFFREGVHFDLLTRHFLPEMIKQGRVIRICSAATSIGCEAYSIAMLFENYREKNKVNFNYEIDAFDVCAEAIETAKNARYTANTLRTDGAGWKNVMDSYLVSNGAEYIVSDGIRKKVNFYAHNIMRGFDKQYDIIFFRNALIYFSSKNRITVINDLADSLASGGILFLGISETSSVKHPMLVSRCLYEVFFFQKTNPPNLTAPLIGENYCERKPPALRRNERQKQPEQSQARHTDFSAKFPAQYGVDFAEVAAILENEEGQPNAKKLFNEGTLDSKPAGELIAAVIYFLSAQDLKSADLTLSHLEKLYNGAAVLFLRGEYHMMNNNAEEAESCFENAAVKEKAFWPAFYRLASLAADGNSTRYEYKIKKARESLELGKEYRYECFMGGFSPDYFQRILNRKLT